MYLRTCVRISHLKRSDAIPQLRCLTVLLPLYLHVENNMEEEHCQ